MAISCEHSQGEQREMASLAGSPMIRECRACGEAMPMNVRYGKLMKKMVGRCDCDAMSGEPEN
jgi:hypothetical protein